MWNVMRAPCYALPRWRRFKCDITHGLSYYYRHGIRYTTSHKGSRRRYRAGWFVDNAAEKWSYLRRRRNPAVSRSYFWMTDDTSLSWWPSIRCRSATRRGVQSKRSVLHWTNNKLNSVKMSVNIASMQFDLFFLLSKTLSRISSVKLFKRR